MQPVSAIRTRMSAEDRRELVLGAATGAFARGGYHGTSTDAVARQAEVSQPYVVRMFGTKLELFLAVFERATDAIRTVFEAVLDEQEFDPTSEEDAARLGAAYADLLRDRDLLQVMMHGFSAGGVPEIAAQSRDCMGRIFASLRRTGWDDETIRGFVAHGMLMNVLVSMRAAEHVGEDPALDALSVCTFGDALPAATAPSEQPAPAPGRR